MRAKLSLMQISLHLERNLLEDIEFKLPEVDKIFNELGIDEGMGETCFLKAILHIKNLEMLQKTSEFTKERSADNYTMSFGEKDQFHKSDLSHAMPLESFGHNRELSSSLSKIQRHPKNMGLNFEMRIQEEYVLAIKLLEQSRQFF